MKINRVVLNKLKEEIERIYDLTLDTPADHEDLERLINKKLLTINQYKKRKDSKDEPNRYSLSISTLQRISGYKKDSDVFNDETLKMVARSLDYKNWAEFVASVIECDKIYDLYNFDPEEDMYTVQMLPPKTKIRFNLGTYSKSFIVEKGGHPYEYRILAIMGLKLNRKVGDSFFAPGIEINQKNDTKDPQIIITDPQSWFNEPEQCDFRMVDYHIL